MTKDDIIKLAKQCGHWSGETIEMNDVGIMDFAALVAEREREACAAMFDDHNVWDEEVGERIRARGTT